MLYYHERSMGGAGACPKCGGMILLPPHHLHAIVLGMPPL